MRRLAKTGIRTSKASTMHVERHYDVAGSKRIDLWVAMTADHIGVGEVRRMVEADFTDVRMSLEEALFANHTWQYTHIDARSRTKDTDEGIVVEQGAIIWFNEGTPQVAEKALHNLGFVKG